MLGSIRERRQTCKHATKQEEQSPDKKLVELWTAAANALVGKGGREWRCMTTRRTRTSMKRQS
jgi:hypothetical protein